MTWTPEVSTINQRVQIGPESTSALGTAVAAGKLLNCFNWVFGINPNVSFFRPVGHKYDTIQEENFEESNITVDGDLDFNGVIYLLASTMGSVAPTGHGSSSTAKDWIFTPPTTGSIVPQTYTLQQGDSVRARSFSYGILNNFGYKGTRKTPFTVSGKGFGQVMSDGITLTSSPTPVAIAPVVGKFFNVYLDSTSGGIGTTQLTRCMSIEFAMDSVYEAFYPLNRVNLSFTAHVDTPPKSSFKFLVEADATGLAGQQTNLQAGNTIYIRVQAQGNQIASDGPGSVYNIFQHDFACKLNKPTDFKDDQGLYCTEWEANIVEDPNWNSGQSQKFTVTNLITSL
jgi:hypothetical protein